MFPEAARRSSALTHDGSGSAPMVRPHVASDAASPGPSAGAAARRAGVMRQGGGRANLERSRPREHPPRRTARTRARHRTGIQPATGAFHSGLRAALHSRARVGIVTHNQATKRHDRGIGTGTKRLLPGVHPAALRDAVRPGRCCPAHRRAVPGAWADGKVPEEDASSTAGSSPGTFEL